MTRIVAVGRPMGSGSMNDGNNTIAYSDNSGVTWTPALYNGDTTKNLFSTRGYDVLYNKVFNMWIAVGVGSSHVIGYSYDGANYLTTNISWTTTPLTDIRSIACNNSRWIVVGEGTNSIAYSDNGFTWTGITGKTIFSDYGYGIDCIGNTWVAAGSSESDASAFVLAYSTDNGITWSDVNKNGGGNSRQIFSIGREVTSYGSLFLAGGTYNYPDNINTLAYSYDGINWQGLGIGVLKDGVWRIATNGTRWIIVGDNDATTFKIAYSDTPTNLSSWQEVIADTFSSFGRGICWAGGDVWIAVGALNPKIMRSINNGISWTDVVDDNKVFNLLGVGVSSNFIPSEPEVESKITNISKEMPKKFGFSDGGNGFMLGRRAFSQNIHLSHKSSNLPQNNSSNSFKPSTVSGIVPKPLINNDGAGMRLQRLRLTTIGSSSLRVSQTDSEISYKSVDRNLVNRALNRVRR